LKTIVTLRDPIARELSVYNHMVNDYVNGVGGDLWYNKIKVKQKGKRSVISFDTYVETQTREEI